MKPNPRMQRREQLLDLALEDGDLLVLQVQVRLAVVVDEPIRRRFPADDDIAPREPTPVREDLKLLFEYLNPIRVPIQNRYFLPCRIETLAGEGTRASRGWK